MQQHDIRQALFDDSPSQDEIPFVTFWSGVVYIEAFLKPLSEAIHYFEADKPLLSCVFPKILALETHFAQITQNYSFQPQVTNLFEMRKEFILNNTVLLGNY